MEKFNNNVWAPIMLNLTHSTFLKSINFWLVCGAWGCGGGGGSGKQRTANCSNPNNPKDGHQIPFKVSRFYHLCEMDHDDYMYHRSRKSFVTHPKECFDEGHRRSVLFYSLGIECVNLKSAPPTTQRRIVVWVKTLRDLQAWKTDENPPTSPSSTKDDSSYTVSPSPIHVPVLVISKYRI